MLFHLVIFGFQNKDFMLCTYRCKGRQNHAPGSLFMCSSSHKGINMLEKKPAHTGCTEAKICAHGAQNVHTGCRVHP